jgi:hypothetical protein
VFCILVIGSWILGASALNDFGLALFIGLMSGAYSSIFIASPILALLKEREPRYVEIRRRLAAYPSSRQVLTPATVAGGVFQGSGRTAGMATSTATGAGSVPGGGDGAPVTAVQTDVVAGGGWRRPSPRQWGCREWRGRREWRGCREWRWRHKWRRSQWWADRQRRSAGGRRARRGRQLRELCRAVAAPGRWRPLERGPGRPSRARSPRPRRPAPNRPSAGGRRWWRTAGLAGASSGHAGRDHPGGQGAAAAPGSAAPSAQEGSSPALTPRCLAQTARSWAGPVVRSGYGVRGGSDKGPDQGHT